MKSLTLILAFLPLIAFSLLARFLPHGYIGIAGLVAAVIALIAILTSHPIWPPKILNTCSLVLFALIAVLGFTLGKNDDRWLATWGGAGVGLGLAIARGFTETMKGTLTLDDTPGGGLTAVVALPAAEP